MTVNLKQIEIPVIYDGQVFRPETPLNLEPHKRYLILVQLPASDKDLNTDGDVWDLLESLAGTIDAPEDWSVEHNHYLYGTPKKAGNSPNG